MFKTIDYWPDVFMVMGCVIIFVALLTLFMTIHGARITPCCSRDDNYDADDPGLSLKTPPSLLGPYSAAQFLPAHTLIANRFESCSCNMNMFVFVVH